VLYIDSRRPAQAFGPAELAVLEALAVQGALAIERARLHEAEAQRERLERKELRAENAALRARLGDVEPVGESESMRRVLDLLRRVAPSSATVCLLGETGTGKEVLARWLHRLSQRASGPFIAVDCGAIPEGLIESELFGHERGAFTGATASREGLFRQAHGGTVFLDEIAELPAALQTRLLRVLQERSVQPVGGSARVPVDVRVVCATHRSLEKRVAEGLFREDLYYRIAVLPVTVPPLRDRGEDVLLLARLFVRRMAEAQGSAVTGFTREALEAMLAHRWPGNVRELENCVQRAALLAQPPYATQADLGLGGSVVDAPAAPGETELPLPPLQEARARASERFERAYLESALERTRGNVSQAAALAEVSNQLFWRLIRKHGVERQRFEAKGQS
jgi:DNA-binding NtrC family response regulator